MRIRLTLLWILLTSVFVSFHTCDVRAEETNWQLDSNSIWGREDGKASMTRDGNAYLIRYTGERDWSVTLHKNIPVSPGDAFRISCKIENEGPGSAAFTVGLFDGANQIINWNHGNASVQGRSSAKTVTHEFVIPYGAATILPRITGHGVTTARCSDFQLIKLESVALLGPVREIPEPGREPMELAPREGNRFERLLQFKGKTEFVDQRGRIPRAWLDTGKIYDDHSTWRIAGADGIDFDMMPVEPFKVKPGDHVFVSLRINAERGQPELLVFPWVGGLAGSTPIANGTFRIASGEETGKWCCIHAYVVVPDGVEGIMPAVRCTGGGVFNVASWTLSRPSDAELNPVRKKVEGYAQEKRPEQFDRGLVAVRSGNDVYLGWRLLKTDRTGIGFDVYQHGTDGQGKKLNDQPITATTDFVVKNVPKAANNRWSVRVSLEGQRTRDVPPFYQSDIVAAQEMSYRSIPLNNAESFSNIAFADLDGDGRHDFVIKTPNANIDPWYLYWSQSPETYKLQAYNSDGTFLWEYDLGWGIERGIWYSPYLVADLDGDGCAEVAVKTCPGDFRDDMGRVYGGPEHLTILDGKTGKERVKIDWPSRDGLAYNYSNRHQLCLAYLDGKTPCIIVERGTYNRITAVAYQMLPGTDRLEELWRWDNRWERHLGRWGQGAHTMHAVDLDNDGRDEVLLGSIALDDDGSILWEQKLGHPDHVYVGDIDPLRDGLEVVFGIETRQPKNGVLMVDGKSGQVLWGLDQQTYHIHSSGMVSDIDPAHPGCETWSGEENSEKERWLRNAQGEFLDIPEKFPVGNLAPRSVWWDGGLQRKMIIGPRPVNYPTFEAFDDTRYEGGIRLIGDLFGDWREEVVTSQKGEIRIYTTTIPAQGRRTTLLQDANYRATLTESTMGYPQIPLPSLDLKKTSGR